MAKAADGRTSQRLLVSVNDVRQFDPKLATQLLRQPLHFLAPWTEVVTERVQHATGKKNTSESISLAARTHLGFVGTFGSHHVSPRELRASQLGTMVCVEGVITRCSITRPKVVRSVHWCASTQQHITREYRDSTALDMNIMAVANTETESKDSPSFHSLQAPRSSPSSDADGNILETEFGLSVYKDHQCVTIQEPPESAPLGQLPRSVEVFLDDDLVDTVKPGDRVKCSGIYRALTHNNPITSGVFRTVVLANSLAFHGHGNTAASLSPRDLANIRKIAKQFEVERSIQDTSEAVSSGFGRMLHALGVGFAPSICGHESIKRALVLQLVGGTEKNLVSGSRLRGDINVLLVGDPSTAKSQLLRASMRVAPLAVSRMLSMLFNVITHIHR
jgi:DNA replication licensing factor MCM3